jgi:hypothetical protein
MNNLATVLSNQGKYVVIFDIWRNAPKLLTHASPVNQR